jgi:hypothetical protein
MIADDIAILDDVGGPSVAAGPPCPPGRASDSEAPGSRRAQKISSHQELSHCSGGLICVHRRLGWEADSDIDLATAA